jgi:HAD superfamily hydrolase (TIGR01490 family)
MKSAAFFDLDGTLIGVNSGLLWMQEERRHSRINSWQFMQGMLYLAAYRLSAIDMEYVMTKALKTIKGVPEEALKKRVREWFFRDVTPYAVKDGIEALRDHKLRGHPCVLLTTSSPYEAEAACEYFGLEDYISTRYGILNGIFTGTFVEPVCYGEGKVILAERYAAAHGIELTTSSFYTDSYSDVPMLRRVGYPHAVNPDLRLTIEAYRERWPILVWN